MTTDEASELIRDAVLTDHGEPVGPVWADMGAGSGTFTFALARLLGPEGRVVAVDREPAALESLRRRLEARARAWPLTPQSPRPRTLWWSPPIGVSRRAGSETAAHRAPARSRRPAPRVDR